VAHAPLRGAHDRASCVIPIRVGSRPKSDETTLLGGRGQSEGERAMSEASAGGGGRTEIERRMIQRSLQDEDFRQRLLDDPRGTLEQELGSGLPEGVEVRVLEESAQIIYLVLPRASAVGEGGELSDQELEAVAGGSDTWLQCGPVTSNVMCTDGC
jgi:Nitrile hydratase, alpha chain